MANSMYVPPDLLKEIFLRIPLKSLGKFKSVCKDWRSILESKSFIDMHLKSQKTGKKRRKILAGYNSGIPRLSSDSDLEEVLYLQCDTSRPLMSCDGLVCIPEPGWINVLNPSTGELQSFPSGPDPEPCLAIPRHKWAFDSWFSFFPGYWAMGFGRDNVRGAYKVVRICFDPVECDVLDVGVGEWRKLSPPPCEVDPGRRSACVDGSIYWLDVCYFGYRIVAFDLHTEEFHEANGLPLPYNVEQSAQILNLDDHLALSLSNRGDKELEIWCMDLKQERWSKTFSISLVDIPKTHSFKAWWFTPLMVSKEGNVLMSDDEKGLFKYYPSTNTTRPVSPSTCCFISPYLDNLVRLNI